MAPKKKSTTKSDPTEELANSFIESVVTGIFDGHLTKLTDALDARLDKLETDESKSKKESGKVPVTRTATATKTAQKIPDAAPKRTPSASVKPEAGKQYKVVDDFPKIGGAKITYLRTHKDNKSKVVVKMEDERPGFPTGKQTVVPLAALAAIAERVRSTKKVAATKKVTRKVASKKVAKKSSK